MHIGNINIHMLFQKTNIHICLCVNVCENIFIEGQNLSTVLMCYFLGFSENSVM